MKPYSLDFRKKIIDIYQSEPISQRRLAKRFGVAKSFIEKLLKQYRETGSLAPKKRTQQTPTLLSTEQLAVLRQLVQQRNDATLEELQTLLEREIGVRLSRTTVDRMLKKLNITVKKKTFHADEKETERTQNKRVKFWQLVQSFLAENLIFIDESGVNLALTRLSARSPKGQRAHGKRPQTRGKNVSIISALGLQGVVTQVSLLGAIDGLTFEAFIARKLVPYLWSGACVILDNCSIHLGKTIESLIQEAGATLIYLPPYSPDFSPIENCFSKIKSILRAMEARTYPDLAKAIEEAFSQVSLDDIKGWFTHCCYCTSLD
ncbi:IS630 family transposase [Coleofasciculus sp.]|uniref:IS630 family transposase n=1 Tax=Coleofasciculus sp. TaxID=3100458 RepID=UPI0039FB0DEB